MKKTEGTDWYGSESKEERIKLQILTFILQTGK